MNTQCEYLGCYREEQRFSQWWLYLLVSALAIGDTTLFGFAMVKQLALGQPWGDRPMSDSALAIMGPLFILFGWAVVWLVCWMRLWVEVRESGVFIRFRPFVRREILFRDLRGCEARTYRPIWEYGGWGIRFGRRGMAYNVSGNRGVQLELVKGKSLLIGSQRAEELALAIQAGMQREGRG